MSIVAKHFLTSLEEKKERFQDQVTDIFVITEEIDLVDSCLCNSLSKKIDAGVYWYKLGEKVMVCVMDENVDAALEAGKKIIIENFSTISAQYIDKTVSPVLDHYAIIATFETDDIEGLRKWSKNIDTELLVKTNSEGHKCVITTEPLEFISRVKAEHKANPFPNLLNFDFSNI